jgi:hypothetical protein
MVGFPSRRGITPVFGYTAPHSSGRGTSTLRIKTLPSTHYVPLRLPAGPGHGYVFPSPVDRSSRPDARSPRRVSQVPCRSVHARHPVSPRGVRPLRLLVAWRPVSGFATFGRLATPALCNEAEGFACAMADVSAFPGSDDQVALSAAESASWRTSNSHGQFLSTDETGKAFLTHQRHKGRNNQRFSL